VPDRLEWLSRLRSTNGHLGNKWGWEATGYDYRDQSIEGFPCLHEFQVGGIVLMPAVGKLVTVPGPLEMNAPGYRSRFDRKDEFATAGYYSVLLKDHGVKAELTATHGLHFSVIPFLPERRAVSCLISGTVRVRAGL
jgi:Putative alpha-1,2-mannosidase